MNTKNAFSAAQNKSKRTVAAMTANAINAANAIDSLTAADGSIRNRFGKPTHQANKPPPNLPPPTAAAAKPSCAISKKTQTQAQFAAPARANVIMDTTYFGRRFGIMVLFDSISRKALSVTEVKTETNALYAQEIGSLKAKGIEIQSIVCDGRKGIPQTFPDIPVQLCHFHQVQTVRRYLTRNPKTEAGKELWQLALTLKNSRRADFESSLKAWFERHQDFFNERTKNPETGQTRYTHPRLRSAYFSLKRNLDSLFVFEQYLELGILNTTNLLDGTFSDMKRLLRCHQGDGKGWQD